MKTVVDIINQIENTSSTNGKLAILKANKGNELLKKVLYYTYNGNLKYGITRDIIIPYICDFATYDKDIFQLLDKLATSNINDELRKEVGLMLGSLEQSEGELVLRILTKDLRCGISEKTITKVWKDLLPQFGCMLASKYFDNEKVVKGKPFTLTMKMDGFRCIIIKQGDSIRAFTRQNKEYLGLDEILNDVATIKGDIVIDGELLVSNYKDIPPETRYKATSNIVRKDGIKTGVTLVAFDAITPDEFYKGISNYAYSTRRLSLEVVLLDKKHIVPVEKLYQGGDTSVILPLLEQVTSKGEEGLMLNLDNAKYECKRTKSLLKLKKFQTADVKVLNVIEGDGINKDKLGAITIQFEHDGKLHECNCGTGFSSDERTLYYNNPELIIGKIVEIKYFEVTTNDKGGYGLRFPVWIGRIRDKSQISMY